MVIMVINQICQSVCISAHTAYICLDISCIISDQINFIILTHSVVHSLNLTFFRWRRMQNQMQQLSSSSSDEGSGFERVFNGSYGLRTDKSLTFYNTSMGPKPEFYYDNAIQI